MPLVANYDDSNPNIRTGYTRLMDAESIRTLSTPVGYPEPVLYFAGEALPVNEQPTSCAYAWSRSFGKERRNESNCQLGYVID